MSYEPVEGVHYIFDRYAFLNQILQDGRFTNAAFVSKLDQPQKDADIRQAIKLARAMYHPDRQQRSGEKMQNLAARMSLLIDDCDRFLTNPDLRNHYEAKLEEFQKNKPNLISTNGNAILDMSMEMLDINSLLSDDILDTRDFETRIKAMAQYDEKDVEQAKSLFDMMPDNAQVKSIYKSALNKKLVYLTLVEDAAWAKIGVLNRKQKTDEHLLSSEDYLMKVEEALKNVSTTQVDEEIEKRGDSYRIGMAQPPLLLSFNPAAGVQAPSSALMDPAQVREMLDRMKAKARENFEIRADYARDIARQKQDVLNILMTLTPVTALNIHDGNSPLYSFYLVNSDKDDAMVIMRLDLDASTAKSSVSEVFSDTLTLSALRQKLFDRNAFMVERNPEIDDILIEISAAAERTYQKNKDRFVKPDAPQP